MEKELISNHTSFMYKKSLDCISYIMVGGSCYINQTINDLQEIYKRF